MSHWWRAYDEAVDNPKLCFLSDRTHRAWFNLMCLASGNDGQLPPIEILTFKLRMSGAKVGAVIDELLASDLLDDVDGVLRPHNWNGRQYKSDVTDPTAATRMQRYRNRKRNGTVTVTDPETEQRQNTEQPSGASAPSDISTTSNSSLEKKESIGVTRARDQNPCQWPDDFREQFWAAYPKKVDKGAALRKLDVVRRSGVVTFDKLMTTLRQYAAANPDLQFVKSPLVWLNKGCWDDILPGAVSPPNTEPIWKKPPPGCRSIEEIREAANAENIGTEVRSDPGLGQNGSDHGEKLSIPSGGPLCGEGGREEGRAPNGQAGHPRGPGVA